MICPNCGFDSPPGMKFCGNCGQRLTPAEAAAGSVRPFYDSPVASLHDLMGSERRERLRMAGLEAAGQRRNVTVLFADLSGYTAMSGQLDPEDVYRMINQFLGILVEAVYRYEGTIDKITGDGIMALFGAPEAFENNAERAARSALDMQSDVKQFAQEMMSRLGVEPRMRIGLHSGEVIVGGVGTELYMQYTAIGDTVNLARRLEEAAQSGSIYVSESVYRVTRPVLDYESVGALPLKGIPRPVPAYRLTGLRQRPDAVRGVEGLSAPMIGRETELARLTHAVAALAEQRQGHVVVVTGEAGIGKSRITWEVKRRIAGMPVRVLEGAGLSYRRSITYWTFLQILRGYFGLQPNTPEAETREKIAQAVAAILPDRQALIQPYLEEIFPLRPSAGPGAASVPLDPSLKRQQLFIAVRDLLMAEARRQPVVLIFEDLHWVDDASSDLLLYLLDFMTQAPILFYCISRANEGHAVQAILERAQARFPDRLLSIELQSLSPDQSEQLLRELLDLPEFPKTFWDQVLRRAAGNPFYLEEFLRMLIERQVIHPGVRGWTLSGNGSLAVQGVPDSLQGLILARFDRLPARDRLALQVASVIGHEFGVDLLDQVLDGEPELTEALSYLQFREFVLPKEGSHPRAYHFKHMLTTETVYGTLLKRDREVLHAKVAGVIERQNAERLDEYVELLAHHYVRTNEADKALHYLLASGEKAFRAFAVRDSSGYFGQARELLGRVPHTPEQVHTILSYLGDIHTLSGEYDRAREGYQEALASAPRLEPVAHAERVGDLLRKIAVTFEKQGDYGQALMHLEDALRLLEASPQPPATALARVLNDMGWVYFQHGRMDEALDRLKRALALVEDGTDYEIISSIYNRLGGVSFSRGDLEGASASVRKSLVLRESVGDLVGTARSFNNLGVLAELRGDWGQALENYRRSLDLQERIGDVEGTAMALSNIAVIYTNQGQYARADEALGRGLELARSIKHTFLQALAMVNLARVAIEQGHASAGLPRLEQATALLKELNDQENTVYSQYLIGEAHLQLGQKALARGQAMEAIALLAQSGIEETGRSPHRARLLRLLAAVDREEGDLDQALGKLRESIQICQLLKAPLEHVKSLHGLALVQLARGEVGAARLALTEARIIAQDIGAAGELARVNTLLGELGRQWHLR